MLLLEKYNRGEALAAFEKLWPSTRTRRRLWWAWAKPPCSKWSIAAPSSLRSALLKVNPRLVLALQLRADVHLATGKIKNALTELERALRVNPRDESTLARIAACRYLQRKPEEVTKLARLVEAFDSKPAQFYFILAERIEDQHRFADAERYYKKASAMRPEVPWSEDNLGLLYFRMGREKEAREVLTRAFAADAFNVRVSNSLKVLRHLAKYQTVHTAHFTIRFDPKLDRVLARYLTTYLEQIYEDLARRFGYRPKGPILIEVFDSHAMFSGRVIALPDLFTIGPSTGRMFAMVSPHGKGIARPFNWARVLRMN